MSKCIGSSSRVFFLAALFIAPAASAQQPSPPAASQNGKIYLDVVVTHKSEPPVSGLTQQDFTILDNKAPQTITSFQAVQGREAAVDVILVIDAVNAGYETVAFERDQIDRFLRAEGGDLAHPTSLVVLTDKGIQALEDFSKDGNKLSASLDRYTVGLRSIQRSSGFYGDADRFQISLSGLHDLVQREGARPGRKMMIWISPGWPLLSGPGVFLSAKVQERLFGDIVNFSTDLLQSRVTLYSIDPIGTEENVERSSYWQNFVKGISKPKDVLPGDLSLQALAIQSGGAVLHSNNDVTALVQTCLADARAYYELSFDPPAGGGANQYHHLEVRVAKSGLTARTRQGYYSQPESQWQQAPAPTYTGSPREPQ